MNEALLLRALPYVAIAATLGALALALRLGARHGLTKRPVLVGAPALGALPLLYVELVWTQLVADRYVRFDRPAGAALVSVVVGFVALRLLALSPRQAKARRTLTELFLTVSTLAAGLAFLGTSIGRPLDRMTVLVAIDRSRSIDLVPGADPLVRAELDVAERGMREHDRIGTIAFAADAFTEDPPRPKSADRTAQRVEVGRDATDLASAIRRSLAEVPPDTAARVVIVSDGVSTRGDPLEAAAAAVAAEVPIDVLPLDQRKVPDVRVVALRMPARASENEPMELRVVTSSTSAADVEIRVKRDGELLRRAEASISEGEDVLRIKEPAPSPGLHRYDVEITAKDPKLDQAAEDNSGSAFVRVRGPSSALVLEGDPGKASFVQKALEAGAFRVDVGTGASVPADLAGLAGYDVVVLSDIRASDISPAQIDALASYAKDLGGGLLLMGGDRSMGPGGYARTSLEEVSPVSFDLKQERRRASLAEVISIDYSGSMGAHVGSVTKLDLANEAAARSASLLGPSDRLAVAHVDTRNAWTVPMGPVTNPAAIEHAIRAVGVGGGGIYVDLALDEGYAVLRTEKVNLKHFLLFSDGSDAERMTGCRAKVAAAFHDGITTSVVALGKGSDVAELEVLSKVGNGRFYLVEDATRLPSVFTQETILAAKSAINETTFQPKTAAPGPATRGIDFGTAPPLEGYVVTLPKGRASVHLVGPEGDPILATWSVGVGRSAAFTSDLKDRWGGAWTRWPDAARMLSQLARDIAKKGEDPRVRLESDTAGGELHVRATVVGDDGRAQTFRRLAVVAAGPGGFTKRIPLEAVGAGAYAASIPLARPGTYLATAVDEVSSEVVGSTAAVLTAGEELRPTGTDRLLLGRLASMTGGKVRHTLADVFLDRASRRFSYAPVGPVLLLAAAGLLLSGVAARKISFGSGLAKKKAKPAPAEVPPARKSDATTEAIRAVRARQEPPRAVAPALAPIAPRATRSDEPPRSQPPQVIAREGAETRKKTAAEILLEKRRGRGG